MSLSKKRYELLFEQLAKIIKTIKVAVIGMIFIFSPVFQKNRQPEGVCFERGLFFLFRPPLYPKRKRSIL
jgi:hypothetical protein